MPLALKAKVELKWQTVPPKNTYYKVGELVWGCKTYFTVTLDKSVITDHCILGQTFSTPYPPFVSSEYLVSVTPRMVPLGH